MRSKSPAVGIACCLVAGCVAGEPPPRDIPPPPPPRDAGRAEVEPPPFVEPPPPPTPLAECHTEPVPEPFEAPSLAFRWRGEGLPFPTYEHALTAPVVVDFFSDGPDDVVPEVIVVTYERWNEPGVLRAIRGRPPYETVLTIAGDGSAPGTGVPSLKLDGHPAAADLDGDGRPEILAILHDGGVAAFRFDGTRLWASALPVDETSPSPSIAVANLDGIGAPEVIVGRVVLEGDTGALRWQGRLGRGVNGPYGGPLSCAADIAPDHPGLEVIAGRTVYAQNGAVVWSRPESEGDGFCAIADVTDEGGAGGRDGKPEVIRVAGSVVWIHDGATGELRFRAPLAGGNGGAPTVADFDGDGRMEIGVAGNFEYAVFDVDAPGGVLWRHAVEDNSSNVTSSTVFDFNGDGRAEVVYNDEQRFMVLDGQTGREIFGDDNPSRTRTEQPVVADVDNDGNAEIVFVANTEARFAGDEIDPAARLPGIEIWESADDSWVGARPVWNQHAYHIDNVTDVGAIPTVEAPSWQTHDTYRLNRSTGLRLAAPDLAPAAGDAECGGGGLRVCAPIHNRGEERVGPGIAVRFYDGDPAAGGTPIGTAYTTRDLVPDGEAESVCIDWSPAPLDRRPVFVEVDAENAERECVEDNNVIELGRWQCIE